MFFVMTHDTNDLERPLRLAIRSTRLLGIASAGYGIFFVFAYGYLNRYQRYQMFFILFGMLLWVLPGVLLLVNAHQLEQRRRRAAIVCIVAATLQGIAALALFVAQFYFTPVSPIPLVLSALWVAAIVQLVVHLYRSLPLLQIDTERRRGFMIETVQPAQDDERT
jgi:hypothetical protein